MVDYGGNYFQNYTFTLTGLIDGGVIWGTINYTHDSYLPTAAVHQGVIADGETKSVIVMMLPGQESYLGSTQNGITSEFYGSWGDSFTFL